MRHCLRGYGPDLTIARRRLARLRNAQNQPFAMFGGVLRQPATPLARQDDALRLSGRHSVLARTGLLAARRGALFVNSVTPWSAHARSEEHTSELQSRENLVCRL